VLGFIGAQLLRRRGRVLALLLGMVIATTGFTVLTGSTATSRLTVQGEVNAHFRGAYDVLVRPTGSRTELESRRGLLRPNFLTSRFGGITVEQWRRIEQISGVDVAAPIGTLGHAPFFGMHRFDLTAAVDPRATRQVIRQQQVMRTDRGLSVIADAPRLVYVTKRPVIMPAGVPTPQTRALAYSDGRKRGNPCGTGEPWPSWEVQEDGRELPLCLSTRTRTPGRVTAALVVHLDATDRYHFDALGETVSHRLDPPVTIMQSFLVAAVDPKAEARLVGLDDSVVDGRYLTAESEPVVSASGVTLVPAIGTIAPDQDEEISVRSQRMVAGQLAGLDAASARRALDGVSPIATQESKPVTAPEILQSARESGILTFSGGLLEKIGRSGPVEYTTDPDGALRPRAGAPASSAWQDPIQSAPLPWTDTGFRQMQGVPGIAVEAPGTGIGLDPIGYFDPARLTRFDPLAETPLDLYGGNELTGATEADRARLGFRPLAPNSNPAGYQSPAPTFLVPLSWLTALTGEPAPISAVRVRVAGVTGFDPLSRERVRRAANEIAQTSGLDVEVTLGASPAAQTVVLSAGEHGRPELRLSEEWTRKGVAAAIVMAVDRKSLALFTLIILVCLLFVANAVAAAVRHRRAELAVLACLGWSRGALAGAVAGEVAIIGTVAGAVSTALAVPLGRAVGVPVDWGHVRWAVPVALTVALVAGVVPAWRASQTTPLAAVRDVPLDFRPRGHGSRRRSITAMAVGNLWRMPGRTLLAAASLAIGIAGLTMVAAVIWAFHGTVTGSLLGEAVSLQVRTVDIVAVLATVALGLVAVIDVLYLNIRERAWELAVLRAAGWSLSSVGRLVAYEGIGIGVIGAGAGTIIGLGAAGVFAGGLTTPLLAAAGATAVLAVLLAGAAALVPALFLQRMVVAARLTAE
jgi:putative ABC transport system permease protein